MTAPTLTESKANAEAVTARYRLGPIAENILRNLPRVTEYPQHGVGFSGTVAVCAAGPSLSLATPHLKEGRIPVIAVNTAAPALAAAGVRVDVLVCVENLDLSKHIRAAGKVGTVVLDLSAHPNNWIAAKEIGARIGWILESNPMTSPLAYHLGIQPHASGGFGLSAAVELARVQGASGIILCGADLGYPSDKAYADGSGWSGLGVERVGDRLVFTGRPDRDETHIAGGVPALPRDRPLYMVPAVGGGEIPTVTEFAAQAEWLSDWARGDANLGHARAAVFQNCSGGAAIAGWEDMDPVVRLAADAPFPDGAADPQYCGECWAMDLDRARAYLLAQCDAARNLSKHFLEPTTWPDVEAMGSPMQFMIALSAHDWGIIRDGVETGEFTEAQALVAQYRVLAAAADRAEAIIRGTA